jgi:V8-like Glu-specific endopeptidase
MDSPLNNEQLAEHYSQGVSATRSATTTDKPIQVSLLNIQLGEEYEPKLVRENGRVMVTVEAGANGVDLAHEYPKPEVVLADKAATQVDEAAKAQEPDPFFPAGAAAFPAAKDEEFHALVKNRPSVIFGRDDRIVYQDTSFPWRCIGKIQTAVSRSSGCMIGPRHVLTASHCVNWAADGSAGWITFSPGYYNGAGPWGTFYATKIYSWMKNTGSLSDQETAFDYVVLVLNQRIGDTIGYYGGRNFDNSWVNTVSNWVNAGYPGDLTGTERPAYQNSVKITSKQDFNFNGHTGSVLGHFNDITAGMSGGPVFGTWAGDVGPRVVGVCSTREGPPVAVPDGSTATDNEFGGGPALMELITFARNEMP